MFVGALVLLACQSLNLVTSLAPEPTDTPTPRRTAPAGPPTLARASVVPATEAPPPTPIPEPAVATAKDNVRVRALPSTNSAIVDRLNKGDVVNILGRTAANDWWQIALPTDPKKFGWVAAQFTNVTGSIDAVPVVQPGAKPPLTSPAPRPPQPPAPYPKP